MANTSSANGRTQRKSLAEQIDRLDALLNGLAEGINDTVVAAVQATVRTAVAEVLTNEELRRRLQPAAATAPGPTRGLVGRLLGKARAFLGGLLRLVAAGCASAAAAFRKAWARGAEALGAGPGTARTRGGRLRPGGLGGAPSLGGRAGAAVPGLALPPAGAGGAGRRRGGRRAGLLLRAVGRRGRRLAERVRDDTRRAGRRGAP
jgi:hypothetical protein